MSLKSRRRLMNRPRNQLDEPEMVSLIPVDDSLPFPWNDRTKYVVLRLSTGTQTELTSNYPIYIIKDNERYYRPVMADGPSWGYEDFPEDVDISELGSVKYQVNKWSGAAENFNRCNFPVQELRYTNNGKKLYIVRE